MNALQNIFGCLSPDQLLVVKQTYEGKLTNSKTQYEKELIQLLLTELNSFLTIVENNYLNNWSPS